MADKVREAGCPDGYGDRHAAKCENAVVAARVIEGAWGDGYIAGRRAALDAPLAAPSGGDATRDEAVVAWAGFNRHGTLIDLDPDKETVEKCVASESTYYPQHGPYRVVALVPQHKEP